MTATAQVRRIRPAIPRVGPTSTAQKVEQARSATGWLPRVVLLLAMAAALGLGLAPLLNRPLALPASAPPTEFSAERAMVHLRAIASEPHPMGSPQHAAAASYLVEQLRALGLEPQVQDTSVAAAPEEFAVGSVPAGHVTNVLARLPGTASTGAILLVGNYDSMPTTPGAGDPDASAAVVLETVRALRADGGALRNDVIVAFMDADPNGLIGDQAFVAEHPWARDATLVLAFANSGVGGPVALESTTAAGRRFVADILQAAPHPLAYSSLTGLLRLMGDGGPMLWAARATGVAGAEFVALDEPQTYHVATSSPDRIDPGTLQDEGSYALALTRHFGSVPLDAPNGPDLVFATIAPEMILAYPTAWAAPLAALVAVLALCAMVLGFVRHQLSWRGFVAGTLLFPLAVMLAIVAGTVAWWAAKMFDPDLRVFLIGVAYNADAYHVGVLLLGLTGFAGVYALLGRWTRAANLTAGTLPWLAAATLLVSAAAPGLSYPFVWPLLAIVLLLGWAFVARAAAARPWPRTIALCLLAMPTVVLVAPFVHILFGLLIRMDPFIGIPIGGGTTVVLALTLGALVPVIQFLGGPRLWPVPLTAAVAGLAVIGWASTTSNFDDWRPKPTSIAYVLDADAGVANWVTADDQVSGWTAQFFQAGASRSTFSAMPNSNPDRLWPAWQAPATALALAAPELTVLEDRVTEGQRVLRFDLSSPRGAENLYVDVQAAGPVLAASLDGKPLDLSAWPAEQRNRFRLAYHGLRSEGVNLGLTLAATGAVNVGLEDRSNGLPEVSGLTITPRPPDTMPAPFEMSDPTIVRRSVLLPGAPG